MRCPYCHTDLSKNAEICNNCHNVVAKKTDYFTISITRLVILYIVTLGIYSIYWMYKNWQEVKNAESLPIKPLWRSIFYIFYLHNLFDRISKTAKDCGYNGFTSPIALTIGFFSMFLVFFVHDQEKIFIIFILTNIIALLSLVLAQSAINFISLKNNQKVILRSGTSFGEVLTIIAGVFTAALYILFTNAGTIVGKLNLANAETIRAATITKYVKAEKSKTKFPVQINQFSELEDITEQHDAIRYQYKINNANFNFSDEDLKKSVLQFSCRKFAPFLNADINFEYSYNNVATNKNQLIVIAKKDCS